MALSVCQVSSVVSSSPSGRIFCMHDSEVKMPKVVLHHYCEQVYCMLMIASIKVNCNNIIMKLYLFL